MTTQQKKEPQIQDVLSFWFPTEDDLHSGLWFGGAPETDAAIRERFAGLHEDAAAGRLDAWAESPRGALALIVLLDQLPRNMFRGDARMFATDGQAQAIAKAALDRGDDQRLPPAMRLFVYMCLEHAEDLALVILADERMEALARSPEVRGKRRRYKKIRFSCRQHLRVIQRFGRYPHRNALLGRETTRDEARFLEERQDRYIRSVRPHRPRLRLLVLHSFRQSARRLSARTGPLRRALDDRAELIYVDAPHPYQATGRARAQLTEDFGDAGPQVTQRCWWNSGEDHSSYDGWEDSLAHLEAVFKEQGPFDGVIGFSQGGAVAGLLAALQPRGAIRFGFAICISGFPSRATDHAALVAPGSIDLPSLHIYGEKDVLVDNARSRALAAAFTDPLVASHPGGHFFPDAWPMDVIRAFVERFAPAPPPPEDPAVKDPSLAAKWASLLAGDCSLETLRAAVTEDLAGLDGDALAARRADLMTVAHRRFRPYRYTCAAAITAALPGDALYVIWQAVRVAAPGDLRADIEAMSKRCGWAAPARLAALTDRADEALLEAIADAFAAQIHRDDVDGVAPSECARAAPRPRSAVDRRCRLGKRIAVRMFPEYDKVGAYIAYRRLVVRLSAPPPPPDYSRPKWTAETLPAPASELAPLIEALSLKTPPPEEGLAFPRGTLMPDGRLDLCKQVVGPEGIRPLLAAMEGNPHVQRLLLGNNIVGNAGAAAIAEHIRAGRSRVDVWYIAGNNIDAEGIVPVCDALRTNPARGLWLKRNPLGPAGAAAVADLLRRDTSLETLDLVNTGILDEGLAHVAAALRENGRLRHLYVGTNGITGDGVAPLADYLGEENRLESLFISANRLGDAGAIRLAEALGRDRSLARLGLASNRIGPDGAEALADAVASHPRLRFLDLGWIRATAAVGELGNRIGNRGARAIAAMLRVNRTLEALDVSHNDISQYAMDAIRDALEGNAALVSLRFPQHGKAVNHDSLDRLRSMLKRNRGRSGVDPELARTPRPTAEILSVYRTA